MAKDKRKANSKAATVPKQQRITASALPVLKRPLDQVGKQILVPGAYWVGRVSREEKDLEYKCTVIEFDMLHKWDDGRPPSAAFQLQEMGVTGTGSLEPGDSSGELFWMTYPMPYRGTGRSNDQPGYQRKYQRCFDQLPYSCIAG